MLHYLHCLHLGQGDVRVVDMNVHAPPFAYICTFGRFFLPSHRQEKSERLFPLGSHHSENAYLYIFSTLRPLSLRDTLQVQAVQVVQHIFGFLVRADLQSARCEHLQCDERFFRIKNPDTQCGRIANPPERDGKSARTRLQIRPNEKCQGQLSNNHSIIYLDVSYAENYAQPCP